MRPGSKRPRQRGNALIEFALAFGFLFPAMTGLFQFGYAFFIYNELQTAVRMGARYAAFQTYQSSNSTPTTTLSDAVKNVVVYGNSAGGTSPIVPSLTTDNVEFTVSFVSGVPKYMSVRIKNYGLNAFFSTFTLNRPSATFDYVGVYAP